MKKKEAKAAAAPGPVAKVVAAAKTLLQSRDVSERMTPDPPRPQTPRRSMQAGHTETALDFIALYATSEELDELAARVREREERKVKIWAKCDNPSCGFTITVRPSYIGGACIKCNWGAVHGGGHMQIMTDAAVAEYKRVEGERAAEIRRREESAALFRLNQDRGNAGLPVFTMAEWRADKKARLEAAGREARVADVEKLPAPALEVTQAMVEAGDGPAMKAILSRAKSGVEKAKAVKRAGK